jgi:molybdate transport system ATP-binding protein
MNMARLRFDCRMRYASGFALAACFEAHAGVTALVGRSGSGKSSVLGLIAGALRPDRGTIILGERTLVDTAARVFLAPERRRVGMVFQEHWLFPHMTVRQNLLFGHGRRGARPMDPARVADVLEIAALLDRRPDSLSGGERQRVALGRALLRGPELLLLDEPLVALDVDLKGRILTYLERAFAEWHIPTLLVSHDAKDVGRLAERVVVLDAGRVIATGATGSVA